MSMAGDWIKFEVATLDKPEVLRMAELLGIKRREMLGLLLDFFVWLDRNSCHGSVTHMSRMSLDDVTHTPGFSAVLCDVGWAEMDDSTGVMTIKHWDRHNGKSAKTRALAKDRKVTERSRSERDKNVTREEKRRDISSLRSDIEHPNTSLPDWIPKDAWQQWCAHRGKKLTAPAKEKQIVKLRTLREQGLDLVAVIDAAIESGWATFYPPRAERKVSSGSRVSREELAAQVCGKSPSRVIDIFPEVKNVAA
jgi:hypothetical protein